jgi:cell filamentation protein, protein adenylyltransferase
MRREDFAVEQRRHVVHTEGGYLAYVPPPLPPEIDLSRDLIERLSVADRAIGELAGAGRALPNPADVDQQILSDEDLQRAAEQGKASG